MTVPEHDVCELVRELVAALDDLGDALAANDLPGLLASEPRLAQASAAVAAAAARPGADPALRHELARARQALRRCGHLGDSLHAFVECSFLAQGRAIDYARHRRPAPAAGVHALTARG
jgi:hypothetical protein